jgi:hypothetical protein
MKALKKELKTIIDNQTLDSTTLPEDGSAVIITNYGDT